MVLRGLCYTWSFCGCFWTCSAEQFVPVIQRHLHLQNAQGPHQTRSPPLFLSALCCYQGLFSQPGLPATLLKSCLFWTVTCSAVQDPLSAFGKIIGAKIQHDARVSYELIKHLKQIWILSHTCRVDDLFGEKCQHLLNLVHSNNKKAQLFFRLSPEQTANSSTVSMLHTKIPQSSIGSILFSGC